MRDDKRVILVKPGDILLIGNVASVADTGKMTQAGLRPLAERLGHAVEALERAGILAFVFAGDIELDKVPGLAERRTELTSQAERTLTDWERGRSAHP